MSTQVKRKAAAADEMIRKLAAEASGESQPAIPDAVEESPTQQTAEVIELEPTEPQEPLVETEHSEQANDTGALADFAELREEARKADARWRSLQGQVDSKDRQIEQLHGLLANMQQAKPEEAPIPDAPIGFTQADTDAFGEDMIDLMQRVATKTAAEQSAKYTDQIAELKGQVAGVTKVTAATVQDTFEGRLTELAPDWQALNNDQLFIDWLQESDTRKQLFDGSAQSKDAKGVAELFNMYAAVVGNAKPQATRRQQLEKQVAPGRARNPAASVASTPEEKIWSRSEIATLYKSKGTMTAEEFAKAERAVSAAMNSDRVDYSR